jgi:hypothetical protein
VPSPPSTHRPVARRPRLLSGLLLALALALGACGESPALLIEGCWSEADWRYERADPGARAAGRGSDDATLYAYPDRRVERHVAEVWAFRHDGTLAMVFPEGRRKEATFRLKGRGHILAVRRPAMPGAEVYRIVELDPDRLVLQYDVGVEVRGIARLTFRREGAAACRVAALPEPRPEEAS